ncbi:MAG: Crp/Fnr family transcriptional regulator [Bacteroidales bacterium]|nr:Crp/Fnr family transcriptional regulator [Bacteroidales bacterium]
MSSFKDILTGHYGFTETDWKISISHFTAETLESREFFCRHGEVCDRLAYVRTGILRSFRDHEDGREITCQFFVPGTVIILPDSFNDLKPAEESVQTYIPSELIILLQKDYVALQEKLPAWQKVCKDVSELKNKKLSERSLQFQTMSAAERYSDFCKRYPKLSRVVPIGHIASYLGMDIATLSRIRKSPV